MSTRIYNLRTRAEVGPPGQSQNQNELTTRRLSPSPTRDTPPHMVGSRLLVGSPLALYSDVVASRSPSPLKETPTAPISRVVGDCHVSYSAPTLLRPAPMFFVTVTLLWLISDPAPTSPTFLVTVTMFRPCSDLAPTSPTFLVTQSRPSRCSDLAPTFLVTPSQYYNSGHSLL